MKTLRKWSNIRLAAFFGTLLAFLIVQAAPEAAQVKGTATYRERIALTPDAVFEATLQDVSKADAAMRGMYRYFADAGLFTECLTRRRWPVAQEKDNAALESAYSKARLTAGEELLVNLEGQLATRPKMEGQGTQPTLVVERFIGVWPTEKCGARFSSAPLESTYWKLTRLADKPVTAAAKQREPHFVLDSKTKRIAGSGGCNRSPGAINGTATGLRSGKWP
jgi:heat shock protein HslJ